MNYIINNVKNASKNEGIMTKKDCNTFYNRDDKYLTDKEKEVKGECGRLIQENKDSFDDLMDKMEKGIEHQNGNKGGKKYSSTRRRKTRSSTRRRRKKRTHKRGNNKRKVSNKK